MATPAQPLTDTHESADVRVLVLAADHVNSGTLRGVAAKGTTGESEPSMALQDAPATFATDRIVIFVRDEDDRRYREHDVCGEAPRRFDIPVTLETRPPSAPDG